MKNLKKLIALILAIVVVFTISACGNQNDSNNSGQDADTEADADTETDADTDTDSDTASDGTVYKIGICNYVDDASLNQIVDNIRAQLDSISSSSNVTFDIQYDNCNADANVLNQIIAQFIADDVDLMVAIATPVAMAMQSATEDNNIPVVFAAVSDPVGAGVVESMDAPGSNLTGTSDALDTSAIMNLIYALDEEAEVALLYDIGQDSSAQAVADAKEYIQGKSGSDPLEVTATNVDEAILAAQELARSGVTAVFTPTDNTIMTAELSIYETLAEAGIKHYTGADSFALNGAFLGYGVDYANLGVETANMIGDILLNNLDPAAVSVKTFDNGTATVNTDICEALGLDYDQVAEIFSPYCTKVQPITTAESFDDLEG